jgi:phage tail-like protein
VSIVCEDPYGAFNFLVRLGDIGGEDEVAGGFPMSVAWEVLRRGLIGDLRLFDWLNAAREGIFDPRTVRIILLDETRQRVCEFVLRGAQPKKWLGPVLAAKGCGEVAMEELHLVVEQIDVRSQ